MVTYDPLFYCLLLAILMLIWATFFRIGWYRAVIRMRQDVNKVYRETSKVKTVQFTEAAEQIANLKVEKDLFVNSQLSKKQELLVKIEEAKKEQEILLEKIASREIN